MPCIGWLIQLLGKLAIKNPPEFQGGFFMAFREKFGNNTLIRQRLAENKSPIA